MLGSAHFTEGEGCSVVLSYQFWSSVLSADPGVVGRSLELDESSCTVKGVMPRRFRFYPERADMWFFLEPSSGKRFRYAAIFARLRPGVTLAQAKTELRAIHASLHPSDDHGKDREAEADDAQRELN